MNLERAIDRALSRLAREGLRSLPRDDFEPGEKIGLGYAVASGWVNGLPDNRYILTDAGRTVHIARNRR